MVWRLGYLSLGVLATAGAALGLGLTLPLQAQVVEDDSVIIIEEDELTDDDSLIDEETLTDEEISLPDGDDDSLIDPDITDDNTIYDEDNIPSLGENEYRIPSTGQNIIIIDGQVYEYDPNDLEGNILLDNLNPVSVGENGATSGTTDGLDSVNRSNRGATIIYPPADNIEALEPEDILE